DGSHSIVIEIEDEDEVTYELTFTSTSNPSRFVVEGRLDPRSGSVGSDYEETSATMTVGQIVRLLQRYTVAEVAATGGENPVRFRQENLLGAENQARVREQRFAPRLPRYEQLSTGQGVITNATNWGFGGGVEWADSPVYLNSDVDPRDMHVRHVIPYDIIEQVRRRGNRTVHGFDVGD
ncbi:hypothetical protein KFL_017250010, partial [Klebsormidium nitens]